MIRWRTLLMLLVLLALGGGAAAYRAARTVPDFYRETLVQPPQQAEQAGDEFAAATFDLANQARDPGAWSALFTDAQVNGWLATEMPQKHPELVPPGFAHPRVRFGDSGLQFGVQYTTAGVETIVWLDLEASMTERHEVAIRFRRVRAGSLPLPPGEILGAVSKVAADLDVPLRWTTVDGDPTALITVAIPDEDGRHYELQQLKISDGKLYVAGRTMQSALTSAVKPRISL